MARTLLTRLTEIMPADLHQVGEFYIRRIVAQLLDGRFYFPYLDLI